jgi:hypothetical protein
MMSLSRLAAFSNPWPESRCSCENHGDIMELERQRNRGHCSHPRKLKLPNLSLMQKYVITYLKIFMVS